MSATWRAGRQRPQGVEFDLNGQVLDAAALNARLILLLANQVGNAQVLADCVAAARDTLE